MSLVNFIVTTTSSIEGYQIESYLGLTSAHVVAGTNFISDKIASISDFWGGRSGTYQNQLSSINEEVLDILKQKASRLGANAVVGLKIDNDEISSKNKAMFMVSAIGTAVRVTVPKNEKISSPSENFLVDAQSMECEIKKAEILEKAEIDKLIYRDMVWSFLHENQVTEIVPFLLEKMNRIKKNNYMDTESEAFIEKSKKFLLSVSSKNIHHSIYENIRENKPSTRILLDIIKKGYFLDLSEVIIILQSDIFEIQKYGLHLLTFDKFYYTEEDIVLYCKIAEIIKKKFKVKARLLENGKWECICGKKNSKKNERCYNCYSDKYGFKSKEPSPKDVFNLLKQKVIILKMASKNKMAV